ncbi:MAG TPA: Re/Si-specific NAD(P)(+) transhydrogenase subunit alpha [Chitinophagaceae bacterium]|jgi:NAD(P) transhydrogenase subunit alpha|nr:Re/Si-specific NAD(P)(+) transhydrogenase subunit alpha [Chitinophagaceae bacterium]
MVIGILKEPSGENRVSLLPDSVKQLLPQNIKVLVEKGAGFQAFADDADYEAAGAVIQTREQTLSQADLVLSISAPAAEVFTRSKKGAVWLGVYEPLHHLSLLRQFAAAGLTVFSLDNIPRTSRAQNMDVRSSQASIAGYKAVLLAAYTYSRYFPMFMTAAGSIAPAKVLVLGAGVAGLQAIATARRLGAVVEVFDTRPAVKEEVMSLGGRFIEVEGAADPSQAGGYAVEQSAEYKRRQQERIAQSVAKADIIITTAQIPGKKAPVLITRPMVEAMRSGSVIVDLAASTGGNTALTKEEDTVQYKGVAIIGNSNLPSAMPSDASKLYGKNILNFLKLLIDKDGKLNPDFDDELVRGTCITREGAIVNDRVKGFFGPEMKEGAPTNE